MTVSGDQTDHACQTRPQSSVTWGDVGNEGQAGQMVAVTTEVDVSAPVKTAVKNNQEEFLP